MKRFLLLMLTLVLCIGLLALPAAAAQSGPTKAEIQSKWKTVTYCDTIFQTKPSTKAPYAAGTVTEEFLNTGITYLNFVRYVAGLPEVKLDATLSADSQYGAVCLAAIDQLTHYPSQPADMDDPFFQRASTATRSANISARWGYGSYQPLHSAVLGCMNDNSSLSNLTCVGHRRWLLNPTLGKTGFGYAKNEDSGWDYIVNHVHDRTGKGCDYDFIAWPVSGNHPTILFDTRNPWSITLNPNKYKTPSLDTVKITVTRQSDGEVWTFDKNTGAPQSHEDAYLTIDTNWYAIPNCIIFHPGSKNVSSYEGVYTVSVTGLQTSSGSAATLHYQVDFFDINEQHSHSYQSSVTKPTCTKGGYTTYTCSCGHSYTGDHTSPLGHKYADYKCIRCQMLPPVPFQDVQYGSFYHIPVLWAVENGITTGASANAFDPNGQCQRAQVVTFLWRAAGKPEPKSANNPFVDVKPIDFFYKAVLWAVEEGITNGLDATHFGPLAPCNRAQVVTFLWRALEEPPSGIPIIPSPMSNPASSTTTPFSGQWKTTSPTAWTTAVSASTPSVTAARSSLSSTAPTIDPQKPALRGWLLRFPPTTPKILHD